MSIVVQTGLATQANAGFPPTSSASHSDMLEIVCGQRDRFKIRLSEMEQETDRVQKQLEIARTELNSLRQDNVKLYEKIRYLQSYTSSSSSSSSAGRHAHDLEKGGKQGGGLGDELEGKYGKLYEDTVVNPFAIFNRKERYPYHI
jgi:homeobox protein cut-like